jgi:hypothetical protein
VRSEASEKIISGAFLCKRQGYNSSELISITKNFPLDERKIREKPMPTITSEHKDLFRTPDTEDKLNLFHRLLNANELTVTSSLALLKIIHEELGSNEYSDRLIYKRYAVAIETLRYRMLDTLQLVVAAWKNRQAKGATPPEWFPEEPKG